MWTWIDLFDGFPSSPSPENKSRGTVYTRPSSALVHQPVKMEVDILKGLAKEGKFYYRLA
jgi:hypothetical protein